MFLRHLVVLPLLFSLCACHSLGTQPQRPYDIDAHLKTVVKAFEPEEIKACEKENTKVCRDRIVRQQLEAYNIVFGQFEDAISKLTQKIHLTGDILVSILTGGGTVINGSQAKSIVSALAGSITGAKNSLDTNLLFQKSLTTVTSRMEALRKEALIPLRQGLLKPIDEYPLTQALLDVEDYFKAGSMQRAISSIEQLSESKTQKADEQKNEILRLNFGEDQNSTLLREFWKPGGEVNSDNAEALQSWIDENVLRGLSKSAFIYGSEYAEARKKAVTALVKKD